jgi:hypothetical protein
MNEPVVKAGLGFNIPFKLIIASYIAVSSCIAPATFKIKAPEVPYCTTVKVPVTILPLIIIKSVVGV